MSMLRASRLRRDHPLPRWCHATRMVSAVPRASKRFMRAMRMWISAVCRSGSLAMMRSPKGCRQRIFALMRLRAWYPGQRFQKALATYRVARRVLVRARAAGQSSFPGRPFLRIGNTGMASRARIAV